MTIRRFSALTAWLTAGHALVFGLFWLLLQVPESNVLMLLASALLVLAMAAAVAVTEGVGLAWWQPESGWRGAIRHALPALAAALPALVVFALVWVATARGATAWTARQGEIDAWLMLHLGWTRTAALHGAIAWLVAFVRYAVGLSLSLTILWVAQRDGLKALARPAWLRRAVSPLRLVLVALCLYAGLWLPWLAASWRARWVAPNWQEPLFVAVKLGVLFLVANVAWAAILGLVARTVRPRRERPVI